MFWRKDFWRVREKPYACPICGWQGLRQPSESWQDVICPECGNPLHLQTWGQTWGTVIALILIVLGSVFLVARLR